ncbi:MAG: hypothetical protein J6Y79_05355 [Paludibacteraceae bacterium]|nr:hypothetical protein [Paludibacteraceae bacterium]
MATASSWNHPKKKNRHVRKPFDSFLLGFAISFVLTIACNIAVFKMHWDTEQPMFYAMKKLAEKGFLSHDMIIALIPSIIMLIAFSAMRKERMSIGAFVGLCPALIFALVYM